MMRLTRRHPLRTRKAIRRYNQNNDINIDQAISKMKEESTEIQRDSDKEFEHVDVYKDFRKKRVGGVTIVCIDVGSAFA